MERVWKKNNKASLTSVAHLLGPVEKILDFAPRHVGCLPPAGQADPPGGGGRAQIYFRQPQLAARGFLDLGDVGHQKF